jgi:hypothetical protein
VKEFLLGIFIHGAVGFDDEADWHSLSSDLGLTLGNMCDLQ